MADPITLQGSILPTPQVSSNHLNLALAQVLPADEGIHSNGTSGLSKLRIYATKAASSGADVVIFPEYFLAGATHEMWRGVREAGGPLPHGGAPASAEEEKEREKHWLEEIQSLAKELDIDIVAGTIVELGHCAHSEKEDQNGEDAGLFNTAYYVERTGKIVGSYTKRNLWHPERETLSSAHPHTHPNPRTFNITTKRGGSFRVGMLICWDLAFPEAFRELLEYDDQSGEVVSGPDLVIVPTCWYATDGGEEGLRWNPDSEGLLLDSLTQTRALEAEAIIAMTNISGPSFSSLSLSPSTWKTSDPAIGVGHSSISAPFLGHVGCIRDPGEALLLASVDMNILKDARGLYKIRGDLGKWKRGKSG